MRWSVFIIVAYLFLVLEQGTRTLFAIGYITPSFLLTLAVFISLWATPKTVAWAVLILGLLVDLTHPLRVVGDGHEVEFVLIGPACLGYLTMSYVTLQLRGMVFRDSPLAMSAVVLVAGTFAHLVMMALLTIRGLPLPLAEPIAGWTAADQLVTRFLDLLYTATVAAPIGYLLLRFSWIWGFPLHVGTGSGSYHSRR